MKKLLVLTLVLGMATLASADLTLTIEGASGSTATFDGVKIIPVGDVDISAVAGTATVGYDITVSILDGDLTLVTGETQFPGAGTTWMFGNTWVGSPTEAKARLTGGSFSPVAVDTVAFSGLMIAGTQGTVQLDEIDDAGAHIISTFQVVPEPATLALLGLGVLALRRKK